MGVIRIMAELTVNNFNNYGYLDVEIQSQWAELSHFISADQYNKLKHDIIRIAEARGIDLSKHLYEGSGTGTVDIDEICPDVEAGQEVSVQDIVKLRKLTKNLVLYENAIKTNETTGEQELKLDASGKPNSKYDFLNENVVSKPLAALYNEVRQVAVDMKNGAPCVSCSTNCKTGCGQTCYTGCHFQCAAANCKSACGGTSGCTNSCSTNCHNETCSQECEATCGYGACKQQCSAACGRDACGVNACTITCGGTCIGTCMTGCKSSCGFESCSSLCKGNATGENHCRDGSCGYSCRQNCGIQCHGNCGSGCAENGQNSTNYYGTTSGGTSGSSSYGCYSWTCGGGCHSGCNGGCTGCSGGCHSGCDNGCTGCKNGCRGDDCRGGCGGCGRWCAGACVGCDSACSDSCAGCSGGCGSGCTGGCGLTCTSGGCANNCNGTCGGGCNNGCGGDCGGCGVSCSGTCGGGCSGDGCGGGCSSVCTNTCTGCSGGCSRSTCSTGCDSVSCYASCISGSCGSSCVITCTGASCSGDACRGTCSTTCVYSCGSGCEYTCGSNCGGSSCVSNCITTCSTTCVSSCNTECISSGCTHNCGSTCSGTCEIMCSSECSNGCKNKCTNSCLGSCAQDVCSFSCSVGCSNTCYDSCGVSCVDSCSDTCVDGCKFGCSDSCKGMVTKSTTYNTKVFNYGEKQEPPHNLNDKNSSMYPNKKGYDPSHPDAIYDNDFATSDNALNDTPYKSKNTERTYNGKFNNDGTVNSKPKAWEFNKDSIVPTEEFEKVPEDAKFDPNEIYYLKNGNLYTEIGLNQSTFDQYTGHASRQNNGGIRSSYLYRKNREFLDTQPNQTNRKLVEPVSVTTVRDHDNLHDQNGIVIVEPGYSNAITGAVARKLEIATNWSEGTDYYKIENGKPVPALSNIAYDFGKYAPGTAEANSGGRTKVIQGHLTQADFDTLRSQGVILYYAGAYITKTSPDNENIVYAPGGKHSDPR